jgi:hypothetical protein
MDIMRTIIPIAMLFSLTLPAAHAADSTARTYADPACSSRTANPENCLIQDGPPRQGTIPAQKPVASPPQSTPQTGSSFSASPAAPTTPASGGSFRRATK